MKIYKAIIAIVLTVFLAVGWVSFIGDKSSAALAYQKDIALADEWTEDGLYQRAIAKYKEVLDYENTEEIWNKLIKACEAWYQESKDSLSEYTATLKSAIQNNPTNVEYTKRIATLYISTGDYANAYKYLTYIENNGVQNDELYELKMQIRYTYSLKNSEYNDFMPLSGNRYCICKNNMWGLIDQKGNSIIPCKYEYLSQKNADGVGIFTDSKNSRLINNDDMVMGIFSFQVMEAGIYSEGLVAVKDGEQHYYYNEFAKQQFGGYEEAGTFQNGQAAVKENGKWKIVNTAGKAVSDDFTDIVLDTRGYYCVNSVILAAKESGKYCIYDGKWKQVGDFTCDQIDLCTSDGLMAFQLNGKWGYVNTEGTIVIEPIYEKAKSFSYGLAAVCQDGKWGFIDSENNLVIDYQFLDADYFNSAGVCMVKLNSATETESGVWQLLVLELGVKK